ncbi:hypothetical protein X777_15010 [Ooceraea biroi]|uniref:Uncharacterized protein n=1 Tax=Ooceraea biroi TaxID=2015173 RepID=A0A026WT33_OOCBI|nr:hypothetical protein X777_15010 [Ooceraea biroi]
MSFLPRACRATTSLSAALELTTLSFVVASFVRLRARKILLQSPGSPRRESRCPSKTNGGDRAADGTLSSTGILSSVRPLEERTKKGTSDRQGLEKGGRGVENMRSAPWWGRSESPRLVVWGAGRATSAEKEIAALKEQLAATNDSNSKTEGHQLSQPPQGSDQQQVHDASNPRRTPNSNLEQELQAKDKEPGSGQEEPKW